MKPIDMPRATVGQSGRFVDNLNPEQEGLNASQGFRELASFFEQAAPVVTTAAKLYVQDEVNKELGKVAGQPEMLDAYRQGDQQAREWISQFRPQTQNIVGQAAAATATATYENSVLAKSQTSGILKSPYSTEEERSAEWARIRGEAQQVANFEAIDPYYLGSQADDILLVEASAKGQLQKLRAAETWKDQNSQLAAGWTAELLRTSQNQQSPQALENPAAFAATSKQWLENKLEQIQQSRTPSEAAQILWDGLKNGLSLSAAGGEFADYQQAQQMLQAWETFIESDVKLANGQPLANAQLSDGKSIAAATAEVRTKLQPLIKEAQNDAAWEATMGTYTRALQGDPTARAEAINKLPMLFSDVRQLNQAMNLIKSGEAFSQTPTQGQLEEQLLLQLDIDAPGLTREQRVQKILGSNLTLEQKITMAGKLNEGGTDAALGKAASNNTEFIRGTGDRLFLAQQDAAANGRLPKDIPQMTSVQLGRAALIEAAKRTRESITERTQKGETLSYDTVGELLRENLTAVENERFAVYQVKQVKEGSPGEQWTEHWKTIAKNLKANGGKPTVDIFPKEIRDQAENAGFPKTFEGVQRYFLKASGTVQESDSNGKKVNVWPRPAESWKQMTGGIKKGLDDETNPLQGAAGLDQQFRYWVEDNIPFFGGSNQEKSRNQGADQPKQNPDAGDWIGRALNSLVGIQPAAAKESELLASENLAVLAKLTRPNSPSPTLDTPTLPQAQANAPATPVPVAITRDTHPFFIAIGINEGTRTADGRYTRAYYGHTDPGNGRRNVGTVSGQQGGSPESTDRRWAGILSGTGSRVEPVLRRLGFEPGTVGFNRLMFNILDLKVQAPAALGSFLQALPKLKAAGLTIESIAKARADAFFIPGTSRLDAPGFGNSYQRLFSDQRSRAGTFDYKRRL